MCVLGGGKGLCGCGGGGATVYIWMWTELVMRSVCWGLVLKCAGCGGEEKKSHCLCVDSDLISFFLFVTHVVLTALIAVPGIFM